VEAPAEDDTPAPKLKTTKKAPPAQAAAAPAAKAPKTPAGNFRFQRVSCMLTYSCPTDADDNPIESKESLFEFLKALPTVDAVVVSMELHKSGKKHYHAYVRFAHKLHMRDPRYFDFEGVHPNIGGSGTEEKIVDYVVKHGDYIAFGIDVEACLEAVKPKQKPKKKDEYYAEAMALAAQGKIAEAKKVIREGAPADYMGKHESHDACLEKIYSETRARATTKPVKTKWNTPLADVDLNAMIRIKNDQGVEIGDPYRPCHVLVGPAGIGKTELARYLLHKAGCQHIVLVNCVEDIKRIGIHDGIVFDEAAFNAPKGQAANAPPECTREEQINILDTEFDRSLRARNSNAVMRSHVLKIFTTNALERAFLHTDLAIARRLVVHDLGSEPMFA